MILSARRACWLALAGLVVVVAGASACGSSPKASGGSAGSPPVDGGAGGAGGSNPNSGPCGPNTLEAGTFDFMFGNVKYTYIVHLPPGYDGSKRTPLVLNWHGLGSNAVQQEAFSGMNAVADKDGFVLVYPNSPDNSWNAGTCCAFNAMTRNDVGFAVALVSKIESQTCIDGKRIYTTGMSNGAFMSYRLGCEKADIFAAIAPVAGKVGIPGCNPSRPVPLLMAFHGTADPLVGYYSGELSADNLSVPDTVKKWAMADGCSGTSAGLGIEAQDGGTDGGAGGVLIESDAGAGDAGPTVTYQMGTVTCQTYSACSDGVTVTLCSALGEGHCWPGTAFCPYGSFTTDINASQQIGAFFAKFSLP